MPESDGRSTLLLHAIHSEGRGEHLSPKHLNNKPIKWSFEKSYILPKSSCLGFFSLWEKQRLIPKTNAIQTSNKRVEFVP